MCRTINGQRGLIDRCWRRRYTPVAAANSAQNIIFAAHVVAMAIITQKRLLGFITSPRHDVIACVMPSIKLSSSDRRRRRRRLTTTTEVDSFIRLITCNVSRPPQSGLCFPTSLVRLHDNRHRHKRQTILRHSNFCFD